MAFNNRKFQKLMEDEQKNNDSLVDEFEDDFADDFEDAAEETQPEAAVFEIESSEATELEPVQGETPAEEENVVETAEPEESQPEEPVQEEALAAEEPVAEEPAAEPAQEEAVCVAEPVIAAVPEEEPAAEVYDPHKMWQDMAALAVRAKECITAGAFFRANDIVTAMRSMLVEMMCRANGINENFNDNADNLSEDCKQDIYTSYAATLNAQELSGAVTHIMAVTYKYI